MPHRRQQTIARTLLPPRAMPTLPNHRSAASAAAPSAAARAEHAAAPVALSAAATKALKQANEGFLQITGQVPGTTAANAQALVLQAQFDLRAAGPKADRTGLATAELAFVRLYAELAAGDAEFQTLFDQATACAQAAGLPHRVADAWALKAFWHGVHDELAALASCARHALAAAEANNHFARVYAHLALAGSLHWVGEYERSAAHFGPALNAARASGQAYLHLLAQRQLALAQAKEARHQWERGDVSAHSLRQAEFDLRAAITLTHELAPRNPAIYLHVFVAEMLTLQGEHSQALALLDEHLPLARSAQAWALVCIASICRAHCLNKTGQLTDALAASDDSLAASTQHPDPDLQAQVHTTRGAILHALGRSDEAAVQSHLAHSQRQQHQALSDQHRHTLLTALAGL